MARSERAKELARKQKAEAKAIKEAKRHSDNPRDWGTFRQIRESYTMTHEYDPKLPWILVGTFVIVFALVLVLGLLIMSRFTWIWSILMGILLGLTAVMFVLTRRVKRATYTKFDGQPGAGEVPLSMLNKKKWSYSPAIAFTRHMDCVHRAVGPAGVILIGDGDPGRLKPMLAKEARRHEHVLYGVTVEQIQIGDGEGQVAMDKLTRHLEKMPKTLDKAEVAEAQMRLKALDAMKQRVPLPKGPMPKMRGSRRAMRGR